MESFIVLLADDAPICRLLARGDLSRVSPLAELLRSSIEGARLMSGGLIENFSPDPDDIECPKRLLQSSSLSSSELE